MRIITQFLKIQSTRSGFIQILHHGPVSWKITPLYFLAQTSYTFDKNRPSKWNFGLFSDWVKIHQIFHVIFETVIQFYFKLCIAFQCHEREFFCAFLAGTLYDFYKRSPSKCKILEKNVTAQVKFHQICTYDRLLLLKICKISAKKVRRSYVWWYWRLMQNFKKNWFAVSKMTRIRWILIQALKSLQNLHFYWSLLWKLYNLYLYLTSYLSWHWRVM